MCKVTSAASVSTAFAGTAKVVKIGTSGIGDPICTFSIASARLGGATVVVTMVVSKTTAAEFGQAQRADRAASAVRLADAAYFNSNTSTLKVRSGTSQIIVQAIPKLAAGTKYAAQIKTAVVAVGKSAASQV